MIKRYLVSVSGGKTSAVMAYMLLKQKNLRPISVFRNKGTAHYTKMITPDGGEEYVFVFANTSREKEETLVFVHNLEKVFNIPIVWVEANVQDGRVGTIHSRTNFGSAKRKGEVFEEVIKKYGIPNKVYSHCTRELKQRPINHFSKSIGWTDYTTVIGYRADEPKRVNLLKAEKEKQWYPLYEWRYTKRDVNFFWQNQPFTLEIQEFEGNCKLCYKKSKRKLLTQIKTDPESAQWIADMEKKYRFDQKENRNNFPKDGVLFFRGNESIHDLIEESKEEFIPATDNKYEQLRMFDIEFDEQESCAESCEPF